MTPFPKLGEVVIRTGHSSDRPTRPPDRQSAFWDKTEGRIYIASIDLEWVVFEGEDSSDNNLLIVPTDFAFDDTYPIEIKTMNINERAVEVRMIVDTAFDSGTTFSIGEAGNVSRLMAQADNDATEVATYITAPGYKYPAASTIHLYKYGSPPSTGTGTILLISDKE